MNDKEFLDYKKAKKHPISTCQELSEYFIGRHMCVPVYLTPKFEVDFYCKMHKLEKCEEAIDKLNKYMYSGYLINSKEIKDILKEVK